MSTCTDQNEAADAAAEAAARTAMEREDIWRVDNPEAQAQIDAEIAAEIEDVESGRIPEAVIEAELLRFDRSAATMLMQAMTDTGLSFAEVDARLGADPGHAEEMLLSMMRGTARLGAGIVEPMLALGHRVELHVTDITRLGGTQDHAEPEGLDIAYDALDRNAAVLQDGEERRGE